MISAFIKLTADQPIGEVKGPVRDRDSARDGSIALLAIEHGIISPRDLATGQATGKRQHQPVTFTKETDQTTPLFHQCIARNIPIKTVDIFFFGYGPSGLSAGREALQYRISLKQAFVSKIEFVGRSDIALPENNRFPLTEKISLIYESIIWEWASPKMAAQDVFSSVQA